MSFFSLPKAARGLFFVLLCCSLHVAYAQELETQPEFDVGDKWTFRYQNLGDRKEPYLYSEQAFKSADGSGWLYHDESENPSTTRKQSIARYDYKRGDIKEIFNFKPNNPKVPGSRFVNWQAIDDRIQFPIAVGKKYSLRVDWANDDGHTKSDVEIVAIEKIKIEAGEFDAYRIKLRGWWNRTSTNSNSGKVEETLWFSPAAKRIVKREYIDYRSNGSAWNRNTSELVKWEPKASLSESLNKPAPAAPVAAAEKVVIAE